MVYARRWSGEEVSTVLGTTTPVASTEEVAKKGPTPMMWEGGGKFQLGQRSVAGGWGFWGSPQSKIDENSILIDDMTKEQLDEAAKTLTRSMKREIIEKEAYELMLRLANASETVDEYGDRVSDEPILNLYETGPTELVAGDEFDTLAKIIAELERVIAEMETDMASKEAVQVQIAGLGGKEIPPPTEESTVPSDVNQLKEKVADIEQHLVPEPGPEPEEEEVPDEWPEEIPDRPTIPESPAEKNLDNAWVKLEALQTYLADYRSALDDIFFNMGWMLEMVRVCLAELSAAKAPGTQTDNYKKNLEGINKGSLALEEGAVFHD